jgi:hypothetical protein
MAIIYTYPIKTAADAGDLVLISDSKDGNKTKNTSISSIKDVIDVVDSISAGPGISVSNPTGDVTVGNTGVLSLTAGSNISLSGSTGNITISTSASNVDGSGTTNRIPRWTDSNTLGDSQISQNGSSIGIGTALGTSTGALEVFNGTLNNQLFITCPDTSQAGINFGGISGKDKGRINYSDNADVMMFHTNSSEKMRIAQNGDVGIGTSSPFVKLQVAGKVRLDYNGANSLQLYRTSTTQSNYIEFYDKYTLMPEALVGYTSNNDQFKIYNAKNSSTEFFTSGIERMAITSTGDIGIGTSSPAAKMTIADAAPILRTVNTSGTNNGYYMNIGMFSGRATLDAYTNSNGSAPLYFATGGSNRMQLSATGNLSLGPFPGTEKLNVDGTVDLTNLKVSGVQGNSGDVLTSSGTGISWAPGGGDNLDHWFAGCASVGSSSSSATNPRQASFTFPNEVGSSNFGPCIPIMADIEVMKVAIKWNGSNTPTIGASGTVDFKLGILTNGFLNPDTQEGTVNYTNVANLTSLQITSADSGTWIYKFHNFAGTGVTPTFNTGQVMVLVFPRPTVGWTGTGATNGDLQMTMQVKYI